MTAYCFRSHPATEGSRNLCESTLHFGRSQDGPVLSLGSPCLAPSTNLHLMQPLAGYSGLPAPATSQELTPSKILLVYFFLHQPSHHPGSPAPCNGLWLHSPAFLTNDKLGFMKSKSDVSFSCPNLPWLPTGPILSYLGDVDRPNKASITIKRVVVLLLVEGFAFHS